MSDEDKATESKPAEIAWRQFEGGLEALVAERTAELTRINQQLQQEIIERQYSEAALSRALQELESIMEAILDIVYVLDLEGNLLKWNQRLEQVTGLSTDQLQGRSALAFFPEVERPMIASAIQTVFAQGRTQVEGHLIGKDAVLIPYEWRGVVLKDNAGNLLGTAGTGRDITERRQTEELLRQSEAKFRSLIQNSSDMIVLLQPDGTIQEASPSHQKILGYSPGELVSKNVFDFVHPENRALVSSVFSELVRNQTGELYAIEFQFRHQDGSWRFLESTGNNLLADPSVQALVINSRDVTERKQAEAQLIHNAFHDALTGLPNRARFMDRLQQAVHLNQRHPETLFAVLFLDLDRFKVINDSLGHRLGDQLLIAIAQRLQRCLRPMDTVARIGGDEFTILLQGIEGTQDALRVAERIQQILADPFDLDGQVVFTSASIGIILGTPDYYRPEDLLRDADIAMYRAKDRGKACCEIFDPSMHTRAVVRWQLETDLRRAVDGLPDALSPSSGRPAVAEKPPEFQVYYQPIITLETGIIDGFEALLRWQHPQQGLLSPSEFMIVLEETGLSPRLHQWILQQACQQIRDWQANPDYAHLSVSVNLSNRQFMQANLADQIHEILQMTDLNAASLKLEITESVIMENSLAAASQFSKLKDLGVQLAIDDFGIGYSSLGRLHQFPIDLLKIDRSLTTSLSSPEHLGGVVETILALARQLGVQATAEGIELEEQLHRLRELACNYGQGFLFAAPLDSQAAEQLLTQQPQW